MDSLREAEIQKKAESLITIIVVAARHNKTVDQENLRLLLSFLDDLCIELSNVQVIKKDMVGTLWYPFTALLAEAGHAQDPDPLLNAAWEIKERLRRIFGPLARTS
jgi:hypothetical protein